MDLEPPRVAFNQLVGALKRELFTGQRPRFARQRIIFNEGQRPAVAPGRV